MPLKKYRRARNTKQVSCPTCGQKVREPSLRRHIRKNHPAPFDKRVHKPSKLANCLGFIGEKKPLLKPDFKATQKKDRRRLTGTPISQRCNNYPIVNCRQCGEEVYLVPCRLKNGGQREIKYTIIPFESHDCDGYVDPLDNPNTVRIFQGKENKFKR